MGSAGGGGTFQFHTEGQANGNLLVTRVSNITEMYSELNLDVALAT